MSDDPERTADISDAFHEGFGAGIGSVQDEIAERVAEAEARGYDRAVANLRDDEAYERWCRKRNFAPLSAADRAEFAEFAEATKETTHA